MLFKIDSNNVHVSPVYVIAEDWHKAIEKYKRKKMKDYNDAMENKQFARSITLDEVEEPAGIALVAKKVLLDDNILS